MLSSHLKWMSTDMFWPAHAGVAAMAGGSEHTSEEERGRGQVAMGQQAGQAAAGQRGNHWGNRHSCWSIEFEVFTLTQISCCRQCVTVSKRCFQVSTSCISSHLSEGDNVCLFTEYHVSCSNFSHPVLDKLSNIVCFPSHACPKWEARVTQYERDFDRVGMTVRKEVLRFEVRSLEYRKSMLWYILYCFTLPSD